MNLVARFESFIERLVERTLTRTPRSHLEPVEVSKRLVRAMESVQSVGTEGVIVPNVYDVFLSPNDYAHFAPMRRSLTQNWGAHVGRVARQRRLFMMSKPIVRMHLDEKLPPGSVTVEPHLQDVETASPEFEHTAVLQSVAPVPQIPRRSPPRLVYEGRTYAVLRSPSQVGRLADNDIVLNDKRVSRHHAEIREQGGRWHVRDTGSTNGIALNGKIVKEALLKPGDCISLGGLEVTWEQ